MAFDLSGTRIWVAGHRGMVGSAIVRRLEREPVGDLILATSEEVDLRRQEPTERFVADTRPDIAIIAAAKVGGIQANREAQADFLYENLVIATNTIEAARRAGVGKVVLLGSSCVYPRNAPQPLREDYLLTGPLEPTNEGYAVAKIAALELAKFYRLQHGMDAISLMPTNLYGPGDNFHPELSHVLPALLRKVHKANSHGKATVSVWGTGQPKREFLHVDDLADATIHALKHYSDWQHLNVGTGTDTSIRELAELIADIVGWSGQIEFDSEKPDGAPRKLLDVSRLDELGWQPQIGLREGIESTYAWALEHGFERNGAND